MKVCQAPKRPMTVFVKRGLVFLVFLISFLVALLIPFIYGTLPYKNENHGINGTRCGKLKNSNMIAGVAYECIIGITTVVIVTTLIVLYSKIGYTVHRKLIIRVLTMKTMKKKYKINTPTGRNTDNSEDYTNKIKTDANLKLIGRDTDVDMTEEQRTIDIGVHSPTNAEEQRPTDLEERQTHTKEQRPTDPDEPMPTDPADQIHTEPEEQRPTGNANTKTFPSPCSKKRKKAHRRIANKLTLMFFIITLLFMVSFLPKVILLNIEGIYQDFWENLSDVQRLLFTFFYQMYIINNIANPFIYAFMDSQFRDDTKAMFKRLCPCP
jgi:phosphatidylglycerophosphate synthase